MSGPSISESVRVYDELKQRLLADFDDLDDETLADTLEGSTDLHERIASLCRASVDALAQAEACKSRIEDLKARADRHKERAARLRAIALWAMGETGLTKVTAPDISVSIGKGRTSVIVTDEAAVPIEFIDYQPKVRKDDIRKALDEGREVPGCALGNSPPSLTIRTK